jgi:hypothetical protein
LLLCVKDAPAIMMATLTHFHFSWLMIP